MGFSYNGTVWVVRISVRFVFRQAIKAQPKELIDSNLGNSDNHEKAIGVFLFFVSRCLLRKLYALARRAIRIDPEKILKIEKINSISEN